MTVDSFLIDENEEEALLFAGDESHYDDPDDEEDYFDPDNEDFDPYDLEDDVHASDWVRGSNWNGDV
ncbi:MAG: hypothetical protein VX063_03815 [SAR324 cluster bacterium]|jgi:hypothetical protein|nr:hypothetical protein [SAR324 cluster bacterium]|tara:strand:- start:409 stop:609 length:201 start_codon:yes stop_codon:yes gene_type:complete